MLSICIKSLFAMYFWRPSFKRPNYTSNWLCSKLLVTEPDRGGQANHFWHFLFLLSFLSQLSSAQQRGVSAKFYNNIFYSQWPPLIDKTRKKFHVSSSYTMAVRSTVNSKWMYTLTLTLLNQIYYRLYQPRCWIDWGKCWQRRKKTKECTTEAVLCLLSEPS